MLFVMAFVVRKIMTAGNPANPQVLSMLNRQMRYLRLKENAKENGKALAKMSLAAPCLRCASVRMG